MSWFLCCNAKSVETLEDIKKVVVEEATDAVEKIAEKVKEKVADVIEEVSVAVAVEKEKEKTNEVKV